LRNRPDALGRRPRLDGKHRHHRRVEHDRRPGSLAVSPQRGGPHTTFTLAFTALASAEPVGGSRIGYTVAVTDGVTGSCVGTRSMAVSAATKGLPVSVGLDPAKLGGAWCAGVHAARMIEIETPVCNPGTMCPQFVRVIE